MMNIQELENLKSKGLLKSQSHPLLDLNIWNYSEKVQFGKLWNQTLLKCRALIVTKDGEIVARSFNKFFNLEENMHNATDDFQVFPKLDGSLCVLFFYDGQWIISSRGSFQSDQSMKANLLLKKYDLTSLDRDKSYSFEIIYPDNQIVVNYGQREELVLLAAFSKDGSEVYPLPDSIHACGFKVSQPITFSDYTKLKERNTPNEEGFVVRFSNGERLKIKFENYLVNHRKSSNLSKKTIFESFKNKQTLSEFIQDVPDEFYPWVKEIWQNFQQDFFLHKKEIKQSYKDLYKKDRKEFVFHIQESGCNNLYFRAFMKLHDGNKDIDDCIHDIIKPKVNEFKTKEVRGLEVNSKSNDLIVLIGVSNSGKSTYAKNYIVTHKKCVIISRDSIRMLLFGYTVETLHKYYDSINVKENEILVTKIQFQLISTLLKDYSVIVDDTNLNYETIKKFFSISVGGREPKVQLKLFDEELHECIKRSQIRTQKVSEKIIRKQYEALEKLRARPELFDLFTNGSLIDLVEKGLSSKLILDSKLPKAVIFDIDGTLALMNNRGPFDWHKVHEDSLNEPVKFTLDLYYNAGVKIVICTGRSKEAAKKTKEWLDTHGVVYHDFYIRNSGDSRKDFIVKEEFWKKIIQKFNILCCYDDRDQVINHGRKLGLAMFQVNEGNF